MKFLASASLVAMLAAASVPASRADPGAVLQRQADGARHRLSAGRQQRRLRAAARPPSRQAHPGQSEHRAAEPARRRLVPDARLCLRRRAEGRLGDRHRRADRAARREARHPGRALQDRRAQLDRPHRLADQHRVPLAHLAGEDGRRRVQDRSQTVRHRRRLHRVDLSDRDEPGAGHEVQADHGLQGLQRRPARGRARRGRGPFDVVDRGEGRASGLAAGQEDQRHRAVLAEETSRAAGRSDRGRARAQRRGTPGAQRRGQRRRDRHRRSSPRPACRRTASRRCAAPSTPP